MNNPRLLLIFLALFLIAPASSSPGWTAAREELLIFRWHAGPPPEVPTEVARSAHKMNFGLSEEQIEEIYQTTGGDVDLRGLHSLRRTHEPLVEYPGLIDRITTGAPPPSIRAVAADDPVPDPELKGQIWFDLLKARESWQFATGQGVTIADCDAGFHIDEPDLRDNLALESRYSITNEADHTNVSAGRFIGHGSSVAAIMASRLDGQGTNGIAFRARIVPLQNYTYDTSIDKIDKEEATAQCVLRAIATADVKIILIENQTPEGSSETFVGTREAIRLALKSGITIVSTAGNSNRQLTREEADDTGSIIVGAVYLSDDKAYFSNYGPRVVVSAFGERVRTLTGPGTYGDFGGTSAAAPQVAATVALMLEANPKLTPPKVKDILRATRITTPKNATVGGRVDTLAAVKAAKAFVADDKTFDDAASLRFRVREILANP